MKRILFACLFLIPLFAKAQLNNNPRALPSFSPFRLSPFSFSFQVQPGYIIEGPVVAEVYKNESTIKLIDSTDIEVTVVDNYVTVSFTQQQIASLPLIAQCYISWGYPERVRRLGTQLKPGVGSGVLSTSKIIVDIVEVQIVGDSYNALVAANRSEAARDTAITRSNAAKIYSDSARVSRNVAIAQSELATEQAQIATSAADSTLTLRSQALAASSQAQADRILTNQYKNLAQADSAATAADRVQTGIDRAQVSSDAASAFASRTAAALSEANAANSATAAAINSNVFTTEAAGRAAVADGFTFLVQGSGDAAALRYRRTNSTTSVLEATYPSLQAAQSGVTALTNTISLQSDAARPRLSENLLINSEDLSTWAATGLTTTLSTVPGPEGVGNFWLLTEQAVSGEKREESANVAITAGEPYVYSIYLKAGNRYKYYMSLSTTAVWGGTPAAYVDLNAKSISNQTAQVQDSGLDDLGNGIFRAWIKATAATSGNSKARIQVRLESLAIGALSYTGDPTKFAYAGFAQVTRTLKPINYIATGASIVQKSIGTFTTPSERIAWNAAAGQASAAVSSVGSLETQVNGRLNLSTSLVPRIQQDPNYNYSTYIAQGRIGNRSWFFAKSTKRITDVGVFIFKRSSQGTISANARVQVLHQRGATFTVLTDQTLTAASLAAYDDVDAITDYRNYEVKVPLTTPITLESGDVICVSISCASGLNPVFSAVNEDEDSGEWNLFDPETGTIKYYRYWTGSTESTHTSMPPYAARADATPGIAHFYESTSDYQRIATIESQLNGTTTPVHPTIETFLPNRIFNLWSDISGYEQRGSSIYLDNIIKLTDRSKNDIRFANGSDRLPLFPKAPTSGNKITETVTVATNTGDWAATSGTISNISTKASVLASQFPKILAIGDSQTEGTNANFDGGGTEDVWWLQMLEEWKKMNVRAGSGYSVRILGSRKNYSKSFTYNNATQTVQGSVEAIGGTSLLSWLKHTVANGTMRDGGQGPWDLLGLGNGTGTDWTGSTAQRAQYVAVCEGQNPPVLTGALYTYLGLGTPTAVSNAINSTEQAAITAAAQNRLNNPENWFFDKDKTGNTRFSLAKYLSRKKTLADDGVTRLTVGSTAGTLVSDVNAFDVCTPTHVIFKFLENEWNPFRPGNASLVGTMFQQAIDAVHAEYPNIHVAVAPIGDISTFFPELYPNVKVPLRDASSWKYDFNKKIKETVVESDVTKSYLLPFYWVQPTAFGWNMLRVGNEMTDKPSYEPMRSYYWTTSDGDKYHPGGFSNTAYMYQTISWVAYTYTL